MLVMAVDIRPQFALEAGLTRALWDLFKATGPQQVALGALASAIEPRDSRVDDFERKVADSPTRAWLPERAPSADLAIITPDNKHGVADILAVIEIKAGAPVNRPRRTWFADQRFDDPVARRIWDLHDIGEPEWNLPQIDLYRSRRWWNDSDGVQIEDPGAVLWLVFDTLGRPAGEIFDDATTAFEGERVWRDVRVRKFAAALGAARTSGALSEQHRDTIAVVLWHLDLAPGMRDPHDREPDPDAIASRKAEAAG